MSYKSFLGLVKNRVVEILYSKGGSIIADSLHNDKD